MLGTFICEVCKGEYERTGQSHKFCSLCKPLTDLKRSYDYQVKIGKIKNPTMDHLAERRDLCLKKPKKSSGSFITD